MKSEFDASTINENQKAIELKTEKNDYDYTFRFTSTTTPDGCVIKLNEIQRTYKGIKDCPIFLWSDETKLSLTKTCVTLSENEIESFVEDIFITMKI